LRVKTPKPVQTLSGKWLDHEVPFTFDLVETAQQNGWVVLTVTDSGCGMNPEFIQRSLFRPFQTTKKQGIGIGMFQCKMIVEAHHGKIEVQSELNKGTTFRILLPTPAKN